MPSPEILVAEDDVTTARLLRRALSTAGYTVTFASDGAEALEQLKTRRFDAILTDWMMPRVDGLELIRWVRANLRPGPVVLMLTALASPEARARALDAGADEYVAKPYRVDDLLQLLDGCLARRAQPVPAPPPPPTRGSARAGFVAVGIAASTGGPTALARVLADMGELSDVAVLVVLHGRSWTLEAFANRLRGQLAVPVVLGDDRMPLRPGRVHVAPGDRHMVVDAEGTALRLTQDPPVNFVRPSADPLFRSLATAFGRCAIAVVLTGLGRDGTVGCGHVSLAGGTVLVEDPASAQVAGMPGSVVEMGIAARTVRLEAMGAAILRVARPLGRAVRMQGRAG